MIKDQPTSNREPAGGITLAKQSDIPGLFWEYQIKSDEGDHDIDNEDIIDDDQLKSLIQQTERKNLNQ